MSRTSTFRPTAANIIRTYREATDDQIGRGASWYADARTLALALDPADLKRAAGVIAAVSPLTPWGRNVMLATRAYADGFASGTMGNSVRAADRILAGEAPLEVLKGRKVRAFYKTIMDPIGTDAVCIDRHAFDIAVGRITDDAARNGLKRKGEYERFERAYVRAAKILGVAPSQAQAVTWVVHRETAIRCAAANRREVEAAA